MSHSTTTLRPKAALRRLAAATAVLAALAAGLAAPAAARPVDPNAPVASDGSFVQPEAAISVQGEESFEGTGKPTRGGRESAEAPPAASGESIIGTDDRVLVNPTTSFPARAVALVTFDGGRCTGWLYGRDVVATAGHCVHDGPGGTWKSNVRVYPGRNGSTSPYGSCTARRLHSVNGWTSSGDERYDYGVIKLNCTVGNTTGWFGYFWQSASLTGETSIINGYPGDKPLTQWRSIDQIRRTEERQLFYYNDTVNGVSGAPVYHYRSGRPYCGGYCSMAIHAYGLHGGFPHSSYNHGTRIAEPVFNNMKAWKDAA